MDRSITEAAVAAGEPDPERALDLVDGFGIASPWIDAVTEIADDLATIQGEAPTGARDTPCIGVACQGGMRGIDLVVLIASACVIAGITMWAAFRDLPRFRLAVVGYLRTAGETATALGHRFAAPFKSRE